MENIRYLIIGAGPSGLSVAHSLLMRGAQRDQILILEKEAIAGGLCRSRVVDGSPLDIGGGHFLDVKNKDVLKFLFHFLPQSDWTLHERIAKIRLRGHEVDHPLESNLWQLPVDCQVDYLESISKTGSQFNHKKPQTFPDWIRWKLGDSIANDYMIPYNQKIWSLDLNTIDTKWLYKLPEVTFREVIRSCIEKKSFGTLPAHAKFYYPKKDGYGSVWKIMGDLLGDRLLTNYAITSINCNNQTVNDAFHFDTLISTMPWPEWIGISDMPTEIISKVNKLVSTSVDIDYSAEEIPSKAHWIYEPDETLPYHRILVRRNFCPGSRGHWTETNSKRNGPSKEFRHSNTYAYPVNSVNKSEMISVILEWAKEKKIIGCGRWGLWEHMNSDIAVLEGMRLAEKMTRERCL